MGSFLVVLTSMFLRKFTRPVKVLLTSLTLIFRICTREELIVELLALSGDLSIMPDVSVDLVVNTIEGP